MNIVYGTDTGSIEAAEDCVVVNVPDDLDDIEEYLRDNDLDGLGAQPVVGFFDIMESLSLILDAEVADEGLRSRIMASLTDAVVNNI